MSTLAQIDLSASPNEKRVEDLKFIGSHQEFIRLETDIGVIDGVFKREERSNVLIVLFPAAMSASIRENGPFPYLSRWQWLSEIPANVWCFEDAPARKYRLAASWFQEKDFFYADGLARVISEIARVLGVPDNKITLMGSSLGGFGALMVAPKIPGSRVIADISQTDLMAYQFRRPIVELCQAIYGCDDVEAINSTYRDRFSVLERFQSIGYVPDIVMMHDISDEPNGKQQVYPFLSKLAEMQKVRKFDFKLEAVVRNTGKGHVALHRWGMLPLLCREAGLAV